MACDQDDEEEAAEQQRRACADVRVAIPEELRPFLMDDWDYLTRQRKLLMLPARITVDDLIKVDL